MNLKNKFVIIILLSLLSYALTQEGVTFQVLEDGMKVWNEKIQEQTGM
ncbi:MAG: hypothetical protein ACRBB5_05865 [Nitrosopumilus sp.]